MNNYTNPTLPRSLSVLIGQLESQNPQKPSDVVKLLKQSDIEQDDLIEFADFDHPQEDSYGRRMIHHGKNFEIMAMSWNKGDMSAIHDHGHTQWGAVKIFGKAEHATFRWDDEQLHTLARWKVNAGDVVGVGHSLIHQMGNVDTEPFVSLHVYGLNQEFENITGDARIFNLNDGEIQRVDGGAFFNLSDDIIKLKQQGPEGDFPTYLRHQIELYNRKSRSINDDASDVYQKIFSKENRHALIDYLTVITDQQNGKNVNSLQWRILTHELKVAASLQDKLAIHKSKEDSFHKYAEIYDYVIGNTSLDSFMKSYIDFFKSSYNFDFKSKNTISVGCGTGLVEHYMIKRYEIPENNIYGMDISESMVNEARARINADTGNILELDPSVRKWDLVYSGLNVFQYIDFEKLEKAIEKAASILVEGGYFLGDFITPDHIRWYPNVMRSENDEVISLRSPEIVEIKGQNFQESEIINISFLHNVMEVNYAGKHKRYLPPMIRIRNYFEKYFSQSVKLYDAVTLDEIDSLSDSCKSTRYIVVAQK